MLRRIFFVLVCVGCQATNDVVTVAETAPADSADHRSPIALDTCAPANTTPTYVRPANDAIGVSSFLGAAGVAHSEQSNWVGLAAGNLCGGSERELVLLRHPPGDPFTIVRGSSPYPVGSGGNSLTNSDAWIAVAAGPLDASGQDSVVAVRHASTVGEADVVVFKADPTSCVVTTSSATGVIGVKSFLGPAGIWAGVTVGRFFGGTVAQMVLVRNSTTQNRFVLANVSGTTVHALGSFNLDTNNSYPWVAVAAGDIDGDGKDELVALRRGFEGASIVFTYKWDSASASFTTAYPPYTDANSGWSALTVGDFNGDGTKSIALVQNSAPNFTVLGVSAGAITQLASSNLESNTASGVNWNGLAAANLVTAYDQGAEELIGLRSALKPYRADLFVYGDGDNRIQRDTGLTDVKSQGYNRRPGGPDYPADDPSRATLIDALKDSHTNTFYWLLERPNDYLNLVAFLDQTQGVCVDGRQLRVWVALMPDDATDSSGDCSWPEESMLTPFSEQSFFSNPITSPAVCTTFTDPNGGWPALLGNLAIQYPHLVGVSFDDFSNSIDPEDPNVQQPKEPINEEMLAQFQSRLHDLAPWVSFVPTFYYFWERDFIGRDLPDYGKLLDTVLFFFRNNLSDGTGGCTTSSGCDLGPPPLCHPNGPYCSDACVAGTCAETTLPTAPSQFCDMRTFLAQGRSLQLGVYFDGLCDCGVPSIRYDYDLTRLAIENRWLGINGTHAYGFYEPTPNVECSSANFLQDDYCAIKTAYGNGDPNEVANLDLTVASCLAPPNPAGRPFGWVLDANGTEDLVYKGSNGHIFDLWRTPTSVGNTDLTEEAGSPTTTASDPTAFVSFDGTQIIVYKGADGHIHTMQFSSGAPVDSTELDSVAPDGGATGFATHALSTNSLVYRNSGGIVHSFVHSGQLGESLSADSGTTAIAAGDPFGYESPLCQRA